MKGTEESTVDLNLIQAIYRGGPHKHILLWLMKEHGIDLPSMWSAEETDLSEEEMKELIEQIENINWDLISASISEAKCQEHTLEDSTDCPECDSLKVLVSTFQTHHCTFTCKKKKKFTKIYGGQGLGLNEEESVDILTHTCRFKFPRFKTRISCTYQLQKQKSPKQNKE